MKSVLFALAIFANFTIPSIAHSSVERSYSCRPADKLHPSYFYFDVTMKIHLKYDGKFAGTFEFPSARDKSQGTTYKILSRGPGTLNPKFSSHYLATANNIVQPNEGIQLEKSLFQGLPGRLVYHYSKPTATSEEAINVVYFCE
jgi:hypothetical protein